MPELIINIITELAHAGASDDIVGDSVAKLLASTKTRRLTIGGFLFRPARCCSGKRFASSDPGGTRIRSGIL